MITKKVCEKCGEPRQTAIYHSPFGGPCFYCVECMAHKANELLAGWLKGPFFREGTTFGLGNKEPDKDWSLYTPEELLKHLRNRWSEATEQDENQNPFWI